MRVWDVRSKPVNVAFTRQVDSWFNIDGSTTELGRKAIQERVEAIDLEEAGMRRRSRGRRIGKLALTALWLASGVTLLVTDLWGLGVVAITLGLWLCWMIWRDRSFERARLRAAYERLDIEVAWMRTWAATPETERRRIRLGVAALTASKYVARAGFRLAISADDIGTEDE